MKKILSILIIAVFTAAALFGYIPTAHADGDISVSVSVYPASVYSAQNVNVTIKISAVGGSLGDVRLYKAGSELQDYGTVTDGETKTYTGSVYVSESELGDNKLVFKVTYSSGGASKEVTKTASVVKMAAKKSLDKSYSVTREYVAEGAQIGFLFKFYNSGSKTISNLRVRDEALSNNAWLGPVSLEAGETKMITYNLALNHDVTVKPEIRYEVDGEEYDESFESKELYIVDEDFDLTIEANTLTPAAGEPVTFTVRMQHNGNIVLRKIKLYNHNNELVKLSGSMLHKGDSVSVVTEGTFTESRTIQFDVTAEDAYGSVYSYASNELEITVPINFNSEDLSVTAEADYKNLPEPGEANFSITLTNNSLYGLDDIRIIDVGTGEEVGSFAHMEKGERLTRVSTNITETRDVVFKVEAADADGNIHSVDTSDAPITITILSEEAEKEAAEAAAAMPETTPTPEPEPQTFFERLSVWAIVLAAIGVLILGVIIAMSVLIAKEKAKVKGSSMPIAGEKAAPRKEVFEGSSVPKKLPKAPKRKKKKKTKGPIRVSYRDRNMF